MVVSLDTKVSFNANPAPKKSNRDAEKKVVTGGGAVAATVTATRTRAAKSGFDMFNSAQKASKGIMSFSEAAKNVSTVSKRTTGLWAKVVENAKWAKNAILNWGTKFKNMKFIKPIVNNKIFTKFAGFLGYGFGFVTLISGLSDITKVTTEMVEEKVLN